MIEDFETAYPALRAYALRVANQRCYDRSRAAEYADEGMLKLWKSWDRVADRPEHERRTWLGAIVRNLIIDNGRKPRQAFTFSLDSNDMDGLDERSVTSPLEVWSAGSDAADTLAPILRSAWPSLSGRQRAFVLATLTYDGPVWGVGPIIARSLGISHEAQKKLKQRTLGALRRAA